MNKGIAVTVLFLTLMCGCVNQSKKNPVLSTDTQIVRQFDDNPFVPDGTYAIIYEPSAYMGKKTSTEVPVYIDLLGDTLRYHKFELKNSYVLHCIPFLGKTKMDRIYIYMQYRLKGKNIDNILEPDAPINNHELAADFKNYFILLSEFGNPPEFDLFDKRTGELVMHNSGLKANIECEAFIYYDYPEGDYQYYIYDLNTGFKTLLILPEDTIKYPWVTYNEVERSLFIKGKRNGYYVLGSEWAENERDEFLVRITKSRGHVADKDSPDKAN